MIGWKVRGQVYQACSEWSDITLEKFIELSAIEIPKKLERLWMASAHLDVDGKKAKQAANVEYEAANADMTKRDLIKVFPEYYGKILELLTDIPPEVINEVHGDVRTEMFDSTLRAFVLSLIYSHPIVIKNTEVEMYTPPEIEKFKLDKEEYHFPKSIKLYGDVIPMADEKIITFAEAADIDLAIRELRSDGIIRFPLFMGIYCRKEGEVYDEKVALERAETFKKASMSVVWALFFCIEQLTVNSQNFIRKSLKSHVQKIRDQMQKAAV